MNFGCSSMNLQELGRVTFRFFIVVSSSLGAFAVVNHHRSQNLFLFSGFVPHFSSSWKHLDAVDFERSSKHALAFFFKSVGSQIPVDKGK